MIPETDNVLSKKAWRKAVLADRGVTAASVAALVPCSEEMVRRVINFENSYVTDKINRIKQIASDLSEVSIDRLWPADEQKDEDSNSRSIGNNQPTNEAGAGGQGDAE